MLWNRYFLPSFLILVLVAALHWIASTLGYYWTVGWYDILMHFLGGAWVALFFVWILSMPIAKPLSFLAKPLGLVFITILVGVAWEIFELLMHFADMSQSDYWIDTPIDIIMDTLGALAVIYYYREDIAKR